MILFHGYYKRIKGIIKEFYVIAVVSMESNMLGMCCNCKLVIVGTVAPLPVTARSQRVLFHTNEVLL